MKEKSLSTDYFDKIYQSNDDPWNFERSDYEREKYAATLAALPRPMYDNAFEIGCSIGVLTQQLVSRCRHLLSVDGSEAPLRKAQARLHDQSHVQFQQMKIPDAFPGGQFDLVLLSEVGYYWSRADLAKAQQRIGDALLPGGHLLLVHWTPYVEDYPLTGDEVHEAFIAWADSQSLLHLHHQRAEQYRLDLWETR